MRRSGDTVLFVLTAIGLAACSGGGTDVPPRPVRVHAAASLGPVMERLSDRFREETGIRLECREASTSTLARQIHAGAAADLFLAASPQWVDALEREGRIERETRRVFARGSLVLVAPAGAGFGFDPNGSVPLAAAFAGRLALGDPDHVPVGAYARSALRRAGWWDDLSSRVVGAGDARAALALVERGECAAGIVYATDARSSANVQVVAEVPARLQDPVLYEAAAVAGHATPDARRFLDWLGAPVARDILRTYGFDVDGETARPAAPAP